MSAMFDESLDFVNGYVKAKLRNYGKVDCNQLLSQIEEKFDTLTMNEWKLIIQDAFLGSLDLLNIKRNRANKRFDTVCY